MTVALRGSDACALENSTPRLSLQSLENLAIGDKSGGSAIATGAWRSKLPLSDTQWLSSTVSSRMRVLQAMTLLERAMADDQKEQLRGEGAYFRKVGAAPG